MANNTKKTNNSKMGETRIPVSDNHVKSIKITHPIRSWRDTLENDKDLSNIEDLTYELESNLYYYIYENSKEKSYDLYVASTKFIDKLGHIRQRFIKLIQHQLSDKIGTPILTNNEVYSIIKDNNFLYEDINNLYNGSYLEEHISPEDYFSSINILDKIFKHFDSKIEACIDSFTKIPEHCKPETLVDRAVARVIELFWGHNAFENLSNDEKLNVVQSISTKSADLLGLSNLIIKSSYIDNLPDREEITQSAVSINARIEKPLTPPDKQYFNTHSNGRNPVQFIGEVYKDYLTGEFTRADLRKIDPKAEMGLRNWERKNGRAPLNLPTKKELNDKRLAESDDAVDKHEKLERQRLRAARRQNAKRRLAPR